jgi:CDP-paratose 2-epimerase
MKILVTGGAGFVGSHLSEYYAKRKEDVVVFDNLTRAELLGYEASNALYNWNYLKKYENVDLIKGDIRNAEAVKQAAKGADIIIHAASQTAITASLKDPRTDFEVNALGTFNVLEAARLSKSNPCMVFCSTNKVYGDNVNKIPVKDSGKCYDFAENAFKNGISETFSTDLCEHTPYGASKLTGDIYIQDYASRHEIEAAVFRMSCIYGPRQFGVVDQGWIAWFTIATILGKPITIFGDGKQVRDVLYISDLVRACDAFIERRNKAHHCVYNIGGGPNNKMSLLELIRMLKCITGKTSPISFEKWRPSDQRVYISNISKASLELGWKPSVSPKDGVTKLVEWAKTNEEIL